MMSTLGIHRPELYRRSRGQKEEKEWEVEMEEEDENRTVNTTNSSVTIQRSNVSESGIARASVDGILREFGTAAVSFTLRAEALVLTVRNTALQRGVDVAILSDEAIIQQAREFVQEQEPQQQQQKQKQQQQPQQPLQSIIARDEESATISSFDSCLDRAENGAPAALVADPDNVDGLHAMNESTGTIFSHSTSTGGTAGAAAAAAAVQATQLLHDSNPDGGIMSDSVHNKLEPIHIPSETSSAAKSPTRSVQQQQQNKRPVRDAAVIANNENSVNSQVSTAATAAATTRTRDDVGDSSTRTDSDNGQDDKKDEDNTKPSAKKPRFD